MRVISRFLKSQPSKSKTKDAEARFLRLYSMWHETHDLSVRKRLLTKLNTVMQRVPDFDLRRRFEQAF